jgi:hypothetical protein
MKLTPKQQEKVDALKRIWDEVSEPAPVLGYADTVLVHVKSHETGAEMWLGIEPDGSSHS